MSTYEPTLPTPLVDDKVTRLAYQISDFCTAHHQQRPLVPPEETFTIRFITRYYQKIEDATAAGSRKTQRATLVEPAITRLAG